MPPSPPTSANSQPKPADPTQPAQPPTNPPTQADRLGYPSYLRPSPMTGRPASTIGGTGLGESGGARPAGTSPASSLGTLGNGLRPSYSPFGSRETTSVPGRFWSGLTKGRQELTSRNSKVHNRVACHRPETSGA